MKALCRLLFVIILTGVTTISYSEDAMFDSEKFGFPLYKGLVHICSGNMLGTPPKNWEILWHVFASNQSPSVLVKDYRAKLGKTEFKQEGNGGSWHLSESLAERHLSIVPIATFVPHDSCRNKIPAGMRSIIEISKMMQKSDCPEGERPVRGKYATIHKLDTYICCPDGAICD